MALLNLLMSPAGLSFDRALVRWTGHSLLNRVFARQAGFAAQPALLLETRGRLSGRKRAAALPWFRIDGKLLIVGSKGGQPTDPAWVGNLRAEPRSACISIANASWRRRASPRAASGPHYGRNWCNGYPSMRRTRPAPRARSRWSCSKYPRERATAQHIEIIHYPGAPLLPSPQRRNKRCSMPNWSKTLPTVWSMMSSMLCGA